jgi:phenylpyruvate tautomerase PptA (4-oxalocrotonate tautomerase family)
MRKEIEKMEAENYGVAWETLWQFREETFDKKYLNEKN